MTTKSISWKFNTKANIVSITDVDDIIYIFNYLQPSTTLRKKEPIVTVNDTVFRLNFGRTERSYEIWEQFRKDYIRHVSRHGISSIEPCSRSYSIED